MIPIGGGIPDVTALIAAMASSGVAGLAFLIVWILLYHRSFDGAVVWHVFTLLYVGTAMIWLPAWLVVSVVLCGPGSNHGLHAILCAAPAAVGALLVLLASRSLWPSLGALLIAVAIGIADSIDLPGGIIATGGPLMWTGGVIAASLADPHRTKAPLPFAVCNQCGYDMRGLPSTICPECGEAISPAFSLRQ